MTLIAKIIIGIISFLGAFLIPINGLLLACGTFVLCDLITGRLAAMKRGEPITSSGYKRTVIKMITYFIGIILAHTLEIMYGNFPFASVAAGYIMLTEMISNNENIFEITGVDLIDSFINKFKKKK